MSLEHLTGPIREGNATGVDCSEDDQFLEAVGCAEYVAHCARVEELRRTSALFEKAERNVAEFHKEAYLHAEGMSVTWKARAKAAYPRLEGPEAVAGEIVRRCEDLLTNKGKDLRVVSLMALAATRVDGVDGLFRSISLCEQLLDTYPDSVHPVVDPADPSDLLRVRALDGLSRSDALRDVLRESTLIAPKQGRSVRFRDAGVFAGMLPMDALGAGVAKREDVLPIARQWLAEKAETAPDAVSDQVLRDWLDARRKRVDAAKEALLRLIDRLAPERDLTEPIPLMLEAMSSLLSSLVRSLAEVDELAGKREPQPDENWTRDASEAPPEEARAINSQSRGLSNGRSNGQSSALMHGPTTSSLPPTAPRLQTRDDARQAILQVAAFIDQTMPGHPAPLFLRRAEKLLAANDFFEIIADIFEPIQTQHVEKVTGQRAPPPPPGATAR